MQVNKRSGSRREIKQQEKEKRKISQPAPERESSDPDKCDRYPQADTDAETKSKVLGR